MKPRRPDGRRDYAARIPPDLAVRVAAEASQTGRSLASQVAVILRRHYRGQELAARSAVCPRCQCADAVTGYRLPLRLDPAGRFVLAGPDEYETDCWCCLRCAIGEWIAERQEGVRV